MWLRPPLRCLPTFQNLISISRIGNQCGCLAEGRSENGGSATGKYPGAPRNPLGVFLVASKMGLRLEVKAAMSGSQTATTSEILAMYRPGQARRIKYEKCAGWAGVLP